MSGFVSPVAYNPPTISQEAAVKAAAGSGKRKIPSGIISNLANKSRRMAYEFQESMEKHVKKKLDSMSGSQNNRKVGLKVAQFIPGKGLEVPGAQVENDASIYCSLGVKGEKLVDPIDETFKQIKGRKISMDFAFKIINSGATQALHDKHTRTTVFNVFRHVNPDSFNYDKTGWHPSPADDDDRQANADWNLTLGPDATHVRRATSGMSQDKVQAGTWRGVNGDAAITHIGAYSSEAAANSLMSPYRYPNNMEIMYSRVNRQLLENYGWMLNPFKFTGIQNNSVEQSGTLLEPYSPTTDSLNVWTNPGDKVLSFGTGAGDYLSRSFPCQVNTDSGNMAYEWHSQLGPGKLSYQFQNDGTNPVCVDICIIGVKKSQSSALATFHDLCSYNYNIFKYANVGGTDLNGFQTEWTGGTINSKSQDLTQGNNEWHNNAKMPFIPDCCFKNPQSYLDAIEFSPGQGNPALAAKEVFTYLEQGKKNPFKVIKRDQFIVSSGSSRAWNTTLPSIKYRPQLYEDIEYPLDPTHSGVTWTDSNKVETTADEYTFMIAIGGSGLPKPLEEIVSRTLDKSKLMSKSTHDEPTANQDIDTKSIVDRQPSSCNISVVGTYSETVYPSYPDTRSEVNFINGRLTEPFYDTTPDVYIPSDYEHKPRNISTVDIAKLSQVVTVADDGVVGVGAVTTNKGA